MFFPSFLGRLESEYLLLLGVVDLMDDLAVAATTPPKVKVGWFFSEKRANLDDEGGSVALVVVGLLVLGVSSEIGGGDGGSGGLSSSLGGDFSSGGCDFCGDTCFAGVGSCGSGGCWL